MSPAAPQTGQERTTGSAGLSSSCGVPCQESNPVVADPNLGPALPHRFENRGPRLGVSSFWA
jgi:hypothetical protein